MEKENLVFNPSLEIVTFAVADIVRTSYVPGENETPLLPPNLM